MDRCREMPMPFFLRPYERMKRKTVEVHSTGTIQLDKTLARPNRIIDFPLIQTYRIGRQSRMIYFQPAHFGITLQKLFLSLRLRLRHAESNGIECHRRPIMRTNIRQHNPPSLSGGSQTPFYPACAGIQRTSDMPFAPHIFLRHLYIRSIPPVIQYKLGHIETDADRIALTRQHGTAHHGVFGKQAKQYLQRTVYPLGIPDRSPSIRIRDR